MGWTIKLADGSTWAQTDDATLGLPPAKGQKVVVHRGSFGAFFLRLNGQPGIKVKRIG
jgi:topoisomerase IA-like protein